MIYGKPVFFTTLRPTLEGAWIPALAMVLECACGTGAISMFVAPVCARLMATDFSNGMLKQTAKKAKRFTNIEVAYADITKLDFPDNCFDKVIAGNVIHLLDNPQAAVMELVRVCKPEGKVIIPTYINKKDGKTGKMAALLGKADAGFKRQTESLSRRRGMRVVTIFWSIRTVRQRIKTNNYG